jgi:S-adenosylmethionine hydrolase
MPLITLTTDWGYKDPYIGALKGAILKECANAQLIDISHEVPAHDIVQGAYIFKNAAKNFPEGTVHIIGIENTQVELAPLLIIKKDNQHFIGADCGIFSMIFSSIPSEIVRIKAPVQLRKTNTAYILARSAAFLSNGGDLYQVGEKIPSFEERIFPRPVIENDFVRTTVIYIDHYGNAVLNLDMQSFKEICRDRSFSILLKRYALTQEKLFLHYSEVEDGEAISIINSCEMLEIAINNGNASQLIGIKTGDIIRLEFHDRPAR